MDNIKAGDRIVLTEDVSQYGLSAGQMGSVVYWDSWRDSGHVVLDGIGSEHRLSSEWFRVVDIHEKDSISI